MLKFDENGLIPAIAQDEETGEVLMLTYMDREAVRRTFADRQAWFYSRSRQELWHKGATSGSYLNLRSVWKDCDEDALLLKVQPLGPACHTGNETCFFREIESPESELGDAVPTEREGADILDEVFRVIKQRQNERPQGSYVVKLLDGGVDRIGKKVVEEAAEAVIAAKNDQPSEVVAEVADLWFHTLLLLASSGVTVADVFEELRRRRK